MINDVKFWQGCCLSSLQTIAETQEAVGLEQTMSRLEGVPDWSRGIGLNCGGSLPCRSILCAWCALFATPIPISYFDGVVRVVIDTLPCYGDTR